MGRSGKGRIQAAYIIAPAIAIVVGLLITAGMVLSLRVDELLNIRDEYQNTIESWNTFQGETTALVFLEDPGTGYTEWALVRDRFLAQCTVCVAPETLLSLFDDPSFDVLVDDVHAAWTGVSRELDQIEALIEPGAENLDRLVLSNTARDAATLARAFVRRLGRLQSRLNAGLERARVLRNLVPIALAALLLLSTVGVILARRRLSIQEDRQLQALDAMIEGVIITDPAGRISFVNSAAAALYGWESDDVIGKLLEDTAPRLDVLNPDAETVSHADLDGRTIECSIREIGTKGTSVNGTIYVLRDMTAFLDQKARDERARQLEGIGSLAGTIAHEFNNILGGMLGSVSLLEADEGNEHRAERAAALRTGISRARKLSNRLMVFSDGHTPARVEVWLNDLLSHEVQGYDFPEDVDCALVRSTPDTRVLVNPEQMGEVFRAILQNSVEAMDGHGTICISTFFTPGGDGGSDSWISVSVDDTGPGISDKVAVRAFDPFFTTHENRRGIGLSIAYQVVAAHDGDIAIANRRDVKGAHVEIHLPAARVDFR
ncbi:MAG: two-component system sensor histidine kinase NtrB [bacterium]